MYFEVWKAPREITRTNGKPWRCMRNTLIGRGTMLVSSRRIRVRENSKQRASAHARFEKSRKARHSKYKPTDGSTAQSVRNCNSKRTVRGTFRATTERLYTANDNYYSPRGWLIKRSKEFPTIGTYSNLLYFYPSVNNLATF